MVLHWNSIQQKVLILKLYPYDFKALVVMRVLLVGRLWYLLISLCLYTSILEGGATPRSQSGEYQESSDAIESSIRQSTHVDGIAGIQAIMSSISNSPGMCYFNGQLINVYSYTAQSTISHPFIILFRLSQCKKDDCKCW